MVKINSPLMSNTASGKIGPRLVFSRRKSGQQARYQKAQKDIITSGRTVQRSNYSLAVASWNSLTQLQKDSYDLLAKNKKMSGYNLFMKDYLSPAPVLIYFDISASSGSNGSITPSGVSSVLQGTDITFNFTADSEYQIADVFIDSVDVGTPSSYTFSNVQADHTIEVSFVSIYDLDALAFFNAIIGAGGALNSTEKTATNNLVLSLKSNSLWSGMKAIYPFVGGSAIAHKFNLKDPRDLDVAFRLTFNGGLTHDANGITPNGSSGYANTHLIPNGNLILNNTGMSYYSCSNRSFGESEIGCNNAGNTNYIDFTIRWSDNKFYGKMYTNTDISVVVGSSLGLFCANRTASNASANYRNGSVVKTSTNTPTSLTTVPILIFAQGINGVASLFTRKKCAWAHIGVGLNSSDNSSLYTIVQAFQTSLGRQV